MALSDQGTKSARRMRLRLNRISILLNLLLFLIVAVFGYFNVSVGKFLATFFVMPCFFIVASFFSKRGIKRINMRWPVEAMVSFFIFCLTLYAFLVEDWAVYGFSSPLFGGLVGMCAITTDLLFVEMFGEST